ncbi:disulfide oxidoreductase [Arcobacter sp. F2176]|uniref:disulfide oxidoreductase n=1 Tax=unclassified Arcobacter TaxID=2593671 RepID=UPI00100BEE55|nr:disulfide oxidoreductase [Arcobacter sp. F2176]RXJ82004.1 disulfide bond formation protein B [Arcobacter sp. F2176]
MKQNSNLILLSFIISLVATLGSLFFSEVMQFIPCSMCWYQRIFMYPLVLIFLINLLYPEDKIFKYTFVLICIGLLFSIYHNLLMFGIISEDMVPCVQGVPCSTVYINWFGFITIPFLSFIAYFLLFLLQIQIYKNSKGN